MMTYPDFINIGLAFLEGLGLILSPCILPILPLILAGSLDGSKKRPIGIICGFVIFFALFTFFSRKLVYYTGIDLNIIRYVSYAALFIFGVVMLSSYLTELFARFTQGFATVGSSFSSSSQESFSSGILFGALVALVWTPCAGPILAAVIVQTVLQKTVFSSFLVVLFFGIGAGIPMLLIAFLGRTIMAKMTFVKKHTQMFRKILGGIIIIAVVYMIYGESSTLAFAKTDSLPENNAALVDGLANPYPAPAIAGITAWINSSPLSLAELKGKVVLIDFWTYSCINCIRTLPYLIDWYQKYHDKGFEIIGVHTPEFDFEKNEANVKNAVIHDGIHYPVALDNDFVTWQNFHNQYWPAHYLIDKNGQVVYEHFGEGSYEETENNIRFLIGITKPVSLENTNKESTLFFQTPETYVGYARMENFASPESAIYSRTTNYSFPDQLHRNQWALQGSWKINSQYILSTAANASLKIHFNAGKVFIVMGNATGFPITVNVLLNDKVITKEQGKDMTNSTITVLQNRLYEVIVLPEPDNGILQLTASSPGLEIYAFTFGR